MKPAPAFYTSPLSAYCADELPGDFHFLDLDEVEALCRRSSLPTVYARETRVLRIIESKRPGEKLRRSQLEILPLLADCVQRGVEAGTLADLSGVFVIEGDPPWPHGANVSRVEGRAPLDWPTFRLTREQVDFFIRCRPASTAKAVA